jgi:hypothetical protein
LEDRRSDLINANSRAAWLVSRVPRGTDADHVGAERRLAHDKDEEVEVAQATESNDTGSSGAFMAFAIR